MTSRFGIQVEIVDPELATSTLTGSFRDQTRDEILANVCLAVDARCVHADGIFRMGVP
jgi:hypothetical protein